MKKQRVISPMIEIAIKNDRSKMEVVSSIWSVGPPAGTRPEGTPQFTIEGLRKRGSWAGNVIRAAFQRGRPHWAARYDLERRIIGD